MQTSVVRRLFYSLNTCRSNRCSVRNFSSNPEPDSASQVTENTPSETHLDPEREEFLQLLRTSSFINMGDPTNKIVRGKIFHTVFDDLYVDFGSKFHCVCPRPAKDGELYVRGTEVLLKLKELELSSHFLGLDTALTLLEADATIVKLIHSPVKRDKS